MMKRKRGHKKGHKSKKPKMDSALEASNEADENIANQNSEQNSADVDESDNNEHESKMEVDIRSSRETDAPLNSADKNYDGSLDNATGKSSGLKVKLKTSKTLEPDVPSQGDTDKSSHQMGTEGPSLVERKDDKASSVPERKPVFNVYRKTKGIKIKSSKVGTSSTIEKSSDAVHEQDRNSILKESKTSDQDGLQKESRRLNQESLQKESSTPQDGLQKESRRLNQETLQKESSTPQGPLQKELKTPSQSFTQEDQMTSNQKSILKETELYNQSLRTKKQELDDSLTVIKKVMKMDAAEPFNAPVNPDALGIPDYFDIIKTPMDFGTICKSLQKGDKYTNSKDVYKDVQYIWDNCCKYNKKGDFIIDLMKRVKKNFMKYWTAADLYSDQATGVESTQVEDAAQSSQGKMSGKSGQLKQKSHKRHGRRHKNDCLCAVCVLKRRKREREENARISQGQSGTQEESPQMQSPSYSSLNTGEDQDIDAGVEDKVEEVKAARRRDSPMEDRNTKAEVEEIEDDDDEEEDDDQDEDHKESKIEKEIEAQSKDKSNKEPEKEPSKVPVPVVAEKLVEVVHYQKENFAQHEEEAARIQQQKLKEMQQKQWRAKMHEKFQIQNPQLLNLCGALFPVNGKSIWSGPHSLSRRSSSRKTSSIHRAIETFLNH